MCTDEFFRREARTVGYFFDIHSELDDDGYASLGRQQVEAIVDAVALAVVAEGEIPESEESELDKMVEALEGRASFSVGDYLDSALDRAREVVGDDLALEDWAGDVAERLDDQTLLEEAYYLASRIAAVDVDVVADETEVLQSYVEVFDLPRERLKRITQRLREHM